MRTFDFHEQLRQGHLGEDLFSRAYPNFIRTDGRKHDLICIVTGKTVEVKYETRTTNKTGNVFVERWSDWDRKKEGGPWQSNADYYCFWFSDGEHFIFETDEFRKMAEQLIAKFKWKIHEIQNDGYVTKGYPIPRKMFEEIRQYPYEF